VTAAVAVFASACAESTAAAPTTPAATVAADHAVPEAPATALSVLLAERTTLKLTARQVDQLTALDHELQVLNAPLEAKLAGFERAHAAAGEVAPTASAALGAGRGMGGGGMSRGMGGGARGMRGGGRGMRGMGGGGPTRGAPASSRSVRASGTSPEEEATRAKMFEHHATALRAAFDLLTPAQRKSAIELLDDNGYDLPEGVDTRPSPAQ
jgi:hypothetical protein